MEPEISELGFQYLNKHTFIRIGLVPPVSAFQQVKHLNVGLELGSAVWRSLGTLLFHHAGLMVRKQT